MMESRYRFLDLAPSSTDIGVIEGHFSHLSKGGRGRDNSSISRHWVAAGDHRCTQARIGIHIHKYIYTSVISK